MENNITPDKAINVLDRELKDFICKYCRECVEVIPDSFCCHTECDIQKAVELAKEALRMMKEHE